MRILYTFVIEMQVDSVVDSVRAWVAEWGAEVAAAQMDVARQRFDPQVVAFGTATGIVTGIDALHRDQWSAVWPVIRGFAFEVDDLVVLPSPDGLQAVAVVAWRSEGRGADGTWAPRPGRATVVLRRSSLDATWLGVHTHFSLVPAGAARS
jgi:ketosteroid isomerase-like protein